VSGGPEGSRLDAEDRAVIRTAHSPSELGALHAREVRSVGSPTDPDHVLPRGASEADDDVPALAGDGARRERGERHEAREATERQDWHAPHPDAGDRGVRARAEKNMHVVAPGGEPRRHPTEIGLGAAAGEPAVHEREPHRSRNRSVSQSARSR